MRKSMVWIMALALLFASTSAAFANVDLDTQVGQDEYSLRAEIIPNIQLEDPGMIKLMIEWTNPTLAFTFDGTEFKLEPDVDVPFKLTNESTVGQTAVSALSGVFNGKLGITAVAKFVETDSLESKNVTGEMTTPGDDFVLTNEAPENVSDDNFKFKYAYDDHDDPYATMPDVSDVQTNLKAEVTFTIKPQVAST